MTITHIDEEPDESANMTVIAKSSDKETEEWANMRGLDEIWIHDIEGTRVVSYHVDLTARETPFENLLGL